MTRHERALDTWGLVAFILIMLAAFADAIESQPTQGGECANSGRGGIVGEDTRDRSSCARGGNFQAGRTGGSAIGGTVGIAAVPGDSVALALAQCMAGEAGWTAERDHAAIAHVLMRRHKQARKRRTGYTLAQQTTDYCMALRGTRQWVSELEGVTEPPHWPTGARWAVHLPRWERIQRTAHSALAGTLPDPCPGAMHWAGHIDALPPGWVTMCDWGGNKFGKVK